MKPVPPRRTRLDRQRGFVEDAVMYPRAVRPFSLEGLPRLPRAAVRCTRALARARAHLPGRLAVPLGGLGAVTLAPARVAFVVPADDGGVCFALHLRGERARLTVDPLLALQLVSDVLGLPAPLAVRPLDRTERGVLAAAITGLLATADAHPFRLVLDDAQTEPIDETDTVVVKLRVEFPGGAGSARLDLPAHLIAAGAGPLAVDPHRLARSEEHTSELQSQSK